MKKHITLTVSIFILIITGIVLLFLIQKNNQSITNKSDTLEYFESKKELNPSSRKALFFRSEQDISNKSPFELCYNSDSDSDGDKIFAGREQLSHNFQFIPMLENVQTGETKLIKSIGYQKHNDGCIHIAKWLDDTHLAQEGKGSQYEAFHSIDVDEDTIERIFESKTQYDQTQYGIGDYLFTQNCDNNQCEEILIFNDPKQKSEQFDLSTLVLLQKLPADSPLSIDIESEFNKQNRNKQVRIESGGGYAVFDNEKKIIIESTIKTASSGWKPMHFCKTDLECPFVIRHPEDWQYEQGQDLKIKAKNSTSLFYNDQKDNPLLTVSEIKSTDFEKIINDVLNQQSYKTAIIQDTNIGNFWGRLINLDNGTTLAFVLLKEEIVLMSTSNLEWEKFDRILNETFFSTDGIPMLFQKQYKAQSNIRSIKYQKADFDGDGISETVMSYISDDELFSGEGRTNGHLKIIDHSGNILKEDIAPQGSNVNHPVKFDTIQVVDFGNDGRQELLVRKQAPYEESEDNKYYVFGFINGEYSDYPIQKGYLHQEKYIDCEKNKVASVSSEGLNLNGLEVSPDGILEKYSYFDYCNSETQDIGIFQRYHQTEFSPEFKNIKSKHEPRLYSIKEGYIWRKDKKLIDQKLNDIIEQKGEGIFGPIFEYESEQFVDIYLADGAGCGGCVWILESYLRINKENDSVEILNLNQEALSHLLARGTPAFSLLSPDKTKLVFISPDYEGKDELWIYDFKTQKEQRLKVFQKGESVAILMGGGGLYSTAIYWSDSKHIIVKPYEK